MNLEEREMLWNYFGSAKLYKAKDIVENKVATS